MKLTLTLKEVKDIVARHYGFTDFELEILVTNTLTQAANLCLKAMRQFTDANDNVLSHFKIAAIKELRNHFRNPSYNADCRDSHPYLLGLVDAKITVENFPEFAKKVTEHGRLPVINRGDMMF